MVAIGGGIAVPACLGLAIFTLTASVMFHAFWQLEGKMARTEISLFLKNITISAALIYIAAVEAGRGNSVKARENISPFRNGALSASP